MRIGISSDVLAAIRTHAAADPAREVCGLLFGTEDRIDAVRAAPNVADDPARRFEIDAALLFAAIRAERAGGPRLAGYYHSHPNGAAKPSATDHEGAPRDGRLWVIVAGDAITGWRAGESGLEPVDLASA